MQSAWFCLSGSTYQRFGYTSKALHSAQLGVINQPVLEYDPEFATDRFEFPLLGCCVKMRP